LNRYFEAICAQDGASQNEAIRSMLERGKAISEEKNILIPEAPRLKGKKLQKREL
jgi:hypothetical protein